MRALAPHGRGTRVGYCEHNDSVRRARACRSARVLRGPGVEALTWHRPARAQQRRGAVAVQAVFRHFDRRAMKVVSVAQLKARWLGYSEVRETATT